MTNIKDLEVVGDFKNNTKDLDSPVNGAIDEKERCQKAAKRAIDAISNGHSELSNGQNGVKPLQNGSSGCSSDSDLSNPKPSTSSESSCSSLSSHGTTTKLAARMADKVSINDSTSSPAEKRFKFEPNEDYLDQLLAMGISVNGATKVLVHRNIFKLSWHDNLSYFQALFYTGNRSVALATNWIFDHPELNLETPLEEEMRRLAAEEAEEAAFDEDEEEEDSDEEGMLQHHYLHHQQCMDEEAEEEEAGLVCRGHGHGGAGHHHNHGHVCGAGSSHHVTNNTKTHQEVYVDDTETDSDSDDFDEEDIPDFKMVFVVNSSLEMGAGKTAVQVGHAALGVQRVLAAKSRATFKVSLSDLGLWQDFGYIIFLILK